MITLLISTATALALLTLAPMLYLAAAPVARPRHARPKDYQGPPNRAPFPIVAGEIPDDVALAARLASSLGVSTLSPLNTDVLRNMMRRDQAAAHGRRLV